MVPGSRSLLGEGSKARFKLRQAGARGGVGEQHGGLRIAWGSRKNVFRFLEGIGESSDADEDRTKLEADCGIGGLEFFGARQELGGRKNFAAFEIDQAEPGNSLRAILRELESVQVLDASCLQVTFLPRGVSAFKMAGEA